MLLLQAFVVVGDNNGHVGLGVKCAKEVGPRMLSASCTAASLDMLARTDLPLNAAKTMSNAFGQGW